MIGAVTIQFDKARLERLRELLGSHAKAFPRVIANALNRTSDVMRSHVSHRAAAALGVKLRMISAHIHHTRANPDKLHCHIYVDDGGFSLMALGAKWVDRQHLHGVMITRGADIVGQSVFPHAFIATPWARSSWRLQPGGRGLSGRPSGATWAQLKMGIRNPIGPYLSAKGNLMSGTSPGGDYEMVRAGQSNANVYERQGASRFPLNQQRAPGVVETVQKAGGWESEYALALDYLDKRMNAETERVLAGEWAGVRSSLGESSAEFESRMGAEYVEREAA
jgi:hypothetical protein